MEHFLQEIKLALENKLYLLALQTALTLPDICGAMESDAGKANRERYCNWYDKYAASKVDACYMSSMDCYLFRCSLLHQGTTIPTPKGNQSAAHGRIVFIAPGNQNFYFHNNIIGDALNIDLNVFCTGMIKATEEWLKTMKETKNANYEKHAKKLIRYYPVGLPPYTFGIGTIG